MAAGDAEQRLRKVMDKLYHSPKPRPAVPSGKRMESGPTGSFDKGMRVPAAVAASISRAPLCRPWDRGDLTRRLATFKAMTWFGKPKTISPLNCARRGWINVEMDIIVCEACGARLLFSTPSSWEFQQVEKAAAVFSLKLDNGHKLLCPWIDNACDEALALFPPTPPKALVDSYYERSFALLKLSALPMISSSAIDYMKMKSPLVEHFLSEASHYPIKLGNDIEIVDSSICKDMDGGSGTAEADVFYQVLKLICLCGWEPRILPYFVDSENKSNPSSENAAPSGLTICTYGNELSESVNHDVAHCDPASAVLECRFCGACVALWGFATVQQPLEVYTVVAGSRNQNERTNSGVVVSTSGASGTHANKGGSSSDSLASKENTLAFNATIAGGPLATKQDFKPRVSFPIVSRHLRAELVSSRNCISLEDSCGNQQGRESLLVENSLQPQNAIHGALLVSHDEGSLKRKRSENESLSEGTGADAEVHGAGTGGNGSVSADGEGIFERDGNLGTQEVDAQNELEAPCVDKENVEKRESSHEKVNGSVTIASTEANPGLENVDNSQSVTEQADIYNKANNDTSRSPSTNHGDGNLGTQEVDAHNKLEVPHVDEENFEKGELSHEKVDGGVATASTKVKPDDENVDHSESVMEEQADICNKANNDILRLPSIDHGDGNLGTQEVDAQNRLEVPHADKENVEKGESSHEKVDEGVTTASTAANPDHENADNSGSVTKQADICSKASNDISRLPSINHCEISNKNGESTTSACAIDVETEKGEKDSTVKTKINNHHSGRLEAMTTSYASNEIPKDTFGKRSLRMQFDPIRQHRPYCPWVAPDEGEIVPGWKLVLAAVVHRRKDSDSPTAAKTSSSLLDDMDDPLVSVRRLFSSPPQKRLKGSRENS